MEAAVRRHRRHPAEGGRGGDRRQDQPRRVRHGLEHRELGVRSDAQPPRHDPVPGGSSRGSAAAVAAGFATLGFGSDTGGSIRQPAALCGVVGVKPTYGVVSRMGLVAFASSLDQIGPFATTVADAALALEVIGGHDPATRRRSAPRARAALVLDDGVEVCASRRITDLPAGADLDVVERVDAAFDALNDAGAKIVDVEVPAFTYGLTAYYLVAPSEASSNLARYDGVRYGLRVPAADTNDVHGHPGGRASATRSSGGSCSAPTPSRPATTTPTTARR